MTTETFDGRQSLGKWLMPAIITILRDRGYRVRPATFDEDVRRATDLMMKDTFNEYRVNCRVRLFGQIGFFLRDFTLRTYSKPGTLTELDKVISGVVDRQFYAIATADEQQIHAWKLTNLVVFRLWYRREEAAGRAPGQEGHNKVGGGFRFFAWADLPDGFIIDEGGI